MHNLEQLRLFEDCEIIGGSHPEYVFTKDDYKARSVKFSKMIFEGAVLFENVDLNIGAKFTDCTFNDIFGLFNIISEGYDFAFDTESNNLVFNNCTFKDKFSIEGDKNKIERNLVFNNCIFEKGIEILSLEIVSEGLLFDKCTIKEGFHLNSIYSKNQLRISNCSVECFTTFFDIRCDEIIFIGSNTFSDNVNIKSCILNKGINFNDGIFKKEFWLYLVETKEYGLNIFNTHFEKSLQVFIHWDKKEPIIGINKFYLNGCKFNDGFNVYGTRNLLANKPIIEEIELVVSPDLKGNITFKDVDIGILNIGGFNAVANIKFEHVDINQIKMKGFINNAGFILSGIRVSDTIWFTDDTKHHRMNSAIYIDETNFGKAQIFMSDLSSFNKVVFHNNILVDISTSIVKWFTPEQLDDGNEKLGLIRYKNAKTTKNEIEILNAKNSLKANYRSCQEIYRQLKIVSQKQGDIPQSLVFQRHEMNYYRKIVGLDSSFFNNEKFILFTNQSNDFGQDWTRALKLFIVFSIVFYIPVGFLSSDKLNYNIFINSWSDIVLNFKVVFYYNFKTWFVLLNPTHSYKDIADNLNNYSKWIYFWDFLSRIIVSYFIFQIVSAFRKFNK
jgi:hypothetical protein